MKLDILLTQLFPDGYTITPDIIFSGTGKIGDKKIALIGTRETVIGVQECLLLADEFLKISKDNTKIPILMLVNNNGQKMALKDELLGLNEYIAYLIKQQDLLRREGRKIIALVYGNSEAGGFIAFGMCAGKTYALSDAQTSVMRLEAISRVNKMPLEKLQELSKTVSVFAPGINNFWKTGGLEEIWQGDLNACLQKALQEDETIDNRGQLGFERGGRPMFKIVSEAIINE